MRTIKKEYNVYEFSELSDEAKERAIEDRRRLICEDPETYWAECTTDEFAEQLGLLGFDVGDSRGRKISWSGFSSQGDGACFYGRWNASSFKGDKVVQGWGGDSDWTKAIIAARDSIAEIVKKYPDASADLTHTGRYSHEHSVSFECYPGVGGMPDDYPTYADPDNPDIPEDEVRSLRIDRWYDDFPENDFKEACRDLMKAFYRQLEKEWDYRLSDEAITEELTDGDYEYLEDGTLE